MQSTVAGQDAAGSVEWQRCVVAGRRASLGFMEKQRSCGVVPGLQLIFEEESVLTATHVAQIQRRRTKSAHAMHIAMKEGGDRIQRGLHHRTPIVIKSARDHCVIDALGRVGLLPNRIVPCTLPSNRDVQIVRNWVVHDANLRNSIVQVSDRDCKVGDVMHKVARTIERIDDPKMLAVAPICMRFFGDDGVRWELSLDGGHDGLLRCQVRLRDEVRDPLGLNRQFLSKVADGLLGSPDGRLISNLKYRMMQTGGQWRDRHVDSLTIESEQPSAWAGAQPDTMIP